MRTTIDLPDDLLRRTKAAAALQGMKLKDFVAMVLEAGIVGRPSSSQDRPMGQRRPIPVSLPLTGVPSPSFTNAELEEILLAQDLEKLGLG